MKFSSLTNSIADWLRRSLLCTAMAASIALIPQATLLAVEAPLEVPAEVLEAQAERMAAIERAKAAAVSVFAHGAEGSAGGGSGVVITPDGYALTNFHVVQPCGNFMRCSMADGRIYDAVLVSVDAVGDVALIKLIGRDDFPAAEMGDSDQLRQGDWCFAVGNPFLLATDFQPTVSYGIVSGVHRYQYPAGTLLEYADCIQTDAAINPGNSGGPLFNAEGQLVGINGRGSFEKRGRVNVGVGYAISINQIKLFMGNLHSGRILDHATLGAVVDDDQEGRVVVSNILDTCDAYRRGLRYGDEIISFAGRPISTENGFKNVLGILPRGWRVPLSYIHRGQRVDVLVRLEGVHSQSELLQLLEGPREIQPAEPAPGDDDSEGPEQEEPEDAPAENPEVEEPEAEDPDAEEAPVAQEGDPPAELVAMHEDRYGFSNYYFNRLETTRVWEAFERGGDYSTLSDAWRLAGSSDLGDVEILLGPENVSGSFPKGPAEIDLSERLETQLAPDRSGGLLLALHMWQRLLRLGPENYGVVTYQGTAPVPGHEELADVLIANHDVIETHFFFDPASGQLWGLEMWSASDQDPCEVYFHDYRPQAGRLMPGRIEVRHGDLVFIEIAVAENESFDETE